VEVGVPVVEVCQQAAITEQTLYRWKKQYVDLEIDQVRQLKAGGPCFGPGRQNLLGLLYDSARCYHCNSSSWSNFHPQGAPLLRSKGGILSLLTRARSSRTPLSSGLQGALSKGAPSS
jgi:hypothetical protein